MSEAVQTQRDFPKRRDIDIESQLQVTTVFTARIHLVQFRFWFPFLQVVKVVASPVGVQVELFGGLDGCGCWAMDAALQV